MAGAAFLPSSLLAGMPADQLTGVQLYSVREEMKTDPSGTLEALAKMGYRYVEHANYTNRKFYGYTAKEFRRLLDGLGLQMPSGHTVMQASHWNASANDFTDSWKHTIDDAAVMGQQFVISPSMDATLRTRYDSLMRLLEQFNRSGQLCRKAGMKFGYHNHDFEFDTKVNGHILYDLILQHTDPDLVIQQLDIGNMHHTGARAAGILQKYPGRFASMHVKDEIVREKAGGKSQFESTVLGTGVVGVKEVLALAKKTGGTHHFIIEQEAYQGLAPIDCMRANLAVMKKWGF